MVSDTSKSLPFMIFNKGSNKGSKSSTNYVGCLCMSLTLIVCVLYLCMDIQGYVFLCHHSRWHKTHNFERRFTCTDWCCISVCSGMIISSSCPEGCQVCLYALRSQDHCTRVRPLALVAVLLGLPEARRGGHVADCVLGCHPQWRASVMLER